MKSAGSIRRSIAVRLICLALSVILVALPILTVVIYEAIFCRRYETISWMRFEVEDFCGLTAERSDFISDGVRLAGYKYSAEGVEPRGLVIVSHGLGGGGHNSYMPFINCFTSHGYAVFTYDARGNDNSDGNSVGGLPQGVVDLDSAICHVESIPEYNGLPIALFGHSWGGYSAGSVLSLHPHVSAVVIIAGFNESEDLLKYRGDLFTGTDARLLMPYLKLYERVKFGEKYSSLTAIDGLKKSDAMAMIVHSLDDTTVPTRYGYDKFFDEFSVLERFDFVLYEDRGHSRLIYSAEADAYLEEINAAYRAYVEEGGREYSDDVKAEFMSANLDRIRCFEPDPILMDRIFAMLDECFKQ